MSRILSGGGTDRQGGLGHLHLSGGWHHGDAAEGGEANGEGKGQREGGEGKGSYSQQLTHFPQRHTKKNDHWEVCDWNPVTENSGLRPRESHEVTAAFSGSHLITNLALKNSSNNEQQKKKKRAYCL